MKWGQRRALRNGEIRSARRRQAVRSNKLDSQEDKLLSAKTNKDYNKNVKSFNKDWNDFYKNKDYKTAMKLTTGEKAAVVLLAGATGVVPVAAFMTLRAVNVKSKSGSKFVSSGYEEKKN